MLPELQYENSLEQLLALTSYAFLSFFPPQSPLAHLHPRWMNKDPEGARTFQLRLHMILSETPTTKRQPMPSVGRLASPSAPPPLRKETVTALLSRNSASGQFEQPAVQLNVNKYHLSFGLAEGICDTYKQLHDEVLLQNVGKEPV